MTDQQTIGAYSGSFLQHGSAARFAAFLTLSELAQVLETADFNTKRRQSALACKRALDIVGALLGLLLLSPLVLAAACAIRLETGGPALFVQPRLGRNGKVFQVLKLRTMHAQYCYRADGTQTEAGDMRVTRVGRLLRRWSIDELPQLINVLKGEMSIVGPRCHVPDMKAAGMAYDDLMPHYHLRHLMRPGMTGLAQMRGLRGPSPDASRALGRVHADLEYIATFSVWRDIVIFVRTIGIELATGGRGV